MLSYYTQINLLTWHIPYNGYGQGYLCDTMSPEVLIHYDGATEKLIPFNDYEFNFISNNRRWSGMTPVIQRIFIEFATYEGNYRIGKIEDEWYFVSHRYVDSSTSTHYKCDQFDGLMICLKERGALPYTFKGD
jgi:hypothetical protein